MEQKYYLSVDIGASSGRHMLFSLDQRQIRMEEIYRFDNRLTHVEDHLCWDVDYLFREIMNGMKKCQELHKLPTTMAIDTWAVDYVLVNKSGERLGQVYGYRDHRTDGMDKKLAKLISEDELYARTGIQKQIFNTIYQLMEDMEDRPELMAEADTFLMLPDYFGYLLTGNMASEYTNATSTQLVDPITKTWNYDLMQTLGIPDRIFLPLQQPGYELGLIRKEIADEVGYTCRVLLCASHDTASAVMAMPDNKEDALYISSGTWSLMGVENPEAFCREKDRQENFTNEGGYEYRYRYLKNIMGLWMIQCVRHEYGDRYSFAQLAQMARECYSIDSVVDVNDSRFLSPDSMTEAIKEYCRESEQKVPETINELSKVIYVSLAISYRDVIEAIEHNTGKTYRSIHIIGGGCKNEYLNQITADTTRRIVYAGPSEATAIGNALAQMIQAGDFTDLTDAREAVLNSFEIEQYIPEAF